MGKLLTVLIFCGFVFSACNREDDEENCTEKNTILVNQHAKDYFLFQEGSWWVYEEETTKQKDSIWVGNVFEKKYSPHSAIRRSCLCGYGKCVQDYIVTFMNKYHNDSNKSYLYYYALYTGIIENATGVRSHTGPIDTFKFFPTPIDWIEYNEESVPRMRSAENAYISEIDSITLNGKTYKDIVYVKYDRSSVRVKEAWIAKNLHVIKFHKSDSTTWNLIKYNISK